MGYSFPPEPIDEGDSLLKFKFEDESNKDPLNFPNGGGLKLNDPSNIKTNVEYDPSTGNYNINQKIGSFNYRPPTYLNSEEYNDYELNKAVKQYWKQRSNTESNASKNNRSVFAPKLQVGGEMFDRIFGTNTIDIRPSGSAELTFGANTSRSENPALPEKQRKVTTFDFNEKIQLNLIGQIGDKMKVSTNYNTEAQFDFENQMKLEYTGHEDEIIKKIEAGNVSLPLSSSLITGSQSLFGLKTQLQFGRLTATTVFSQERGKKSEVEVSGGAQTSTFQITADNYEANKHYMISQYFRNHYNSALANLPTVISGININQIEVWVTNKTGTQENVRNILALADLGDTARISTITVNASPSPTEWPDNKNNSLDPSSFGTIPGIRNINQVVGILTDPANGYGWDEKNFVKIESARKLSPSEFTFNSKLGYISLNQTLNDEVLAVAYQYTYDNQTYQVGELSTGGTTLISPDSLLIVKLIKSPVVSPRTQPAMWDLMMKNIYAIGAYQVNPQDFKLDVVYANPSTGTDINYLPVPTSETNINSKPLVQVVGMDKLNVQGDAIPDGVFDFLESVTIIPNNGRVIFTTLEPFGENLKTKFMSPETIGKNFIFPQLYDSSKAAAQQFPDKNRFKLKGTYKSSSSSEISLNAINIPAGSVKVTAGGVALTENLDYTVDYTVGRVKIINQGILNSGVPIKISLESNSLFNVQSKSLLGSNFEYKVSKDFNIGATILRLTERPLTQKINIGDEPISNVMWGLNTNYRTDAPFLTRWIDRLPLIETKAPSSINFSGEFAQLVPGHSKAIGKDGNAYLDDFEGSQSAIDLKSSFAWTIASTPQNQPLSFPEGNLSNNLAYNKNRAKLAWYTMDPLFMRQTNGLTPDYYSNTELSNHFTREILETEVFQNRSSTTGQPQPLFTLDLAFYPRERGQYNYDTLLSPNGNLQNPQSRWGGIMRKIETNDFEAANIEFIQFWLMDPFNSDNTFKSTTGDLFINLGNVSEDVLRDSRRSYENGLPNSNSIINVDTTVWGRVPNVQAVNKAFDIDGREFQDVGLDGLSDDDERTFFDDYLNKVSALWGTAAYNKVLEDPSADDYHYYRGDDYDADLLRTLDRYKKYNGLDGNSPTQKQSDELNSAKYPTSSTTSPNEEDINRDNTLNEVESYYQYRISMRPEDLHEIGTNYITDTLHTDASVPGGSKGITWYQFKVPVKNFEAKFGNIDDYRSIRFMRMYLKGFDTTIVLRFARLELVRSEWRKYDYSLLTPGEYGDPDESITPFNVSAVNIEENGKRSPVNYVLPPGITRETSVQTVANVKLNEQSLSMNFCNLQEGDARAIFKNVNYDMRSYKKLKMFVHAEAYPGQSLTDNEVTMFIRLGTDYTNNYYEYEIPLKITPPDYYSPSNDDAQRIVWPDVNTMELSFETLQAAKQARNIALGGSGINFQTPYSVYDKESPEGKNRITIVGNPNLGTVKTIMVGIRNPKKGSIGTYYDDEQDKCGEIWVNELRLSDFDEKGGWASNARVSATLADFGSLSLSGSMSTPGFGSIEKKVSERSRETVKQYDVSSSLELGKLLNEDLNIKVPMYVGYSEAIRTPQFNPLDPDILLKSVLPTLEPETRDSIKNVTQDYTRRKSINFSNVHKEKGQGKTKSHVYDVENLSTTYAYSEIYQRSMNIEYSKQKNYKGALTYNFSASPKNIKPFEKSKALKSKYFALIKDFNFYPYPKKYGFTTDVNRTYSELKNRNVTASDVILPPNYNKTFSMMRSYDLKYDISKSLTLDFTANNNSRIFEPYGKIDTDEERDTIKHNFYTLGNTNNYRHNTNVNYTVPINKIPLLNFATATTRYSSSYDWIRAPYASDSLGNTIKNSNGKQLTTQFNMVTFYSKIPYFKKILQEKNNAKPGKAPDSKKPANPADTTASKKKKEPPSFKLVDNFAKLFLSVRNISITYSDNSGTILPGYGDSTKYLGLNPATMAPGFGFVFGSQKDIRPEASTNGWLKQSPLLNLPYTHTNNKTTSIRANLEPFREFKVELTGNRSFSENYSEFYRWGPSANDFVHESPALSGNFSISYLTWRTAFKKDDKRTHSSEAFNNLLTYRAEVSQLLGSEYLNSTGVNPGTNSTGFVDGFGKSSQDVLIPAFLAAYSGKNPNKSQLNPFPEIPLPNWRITYTGLMKMEKIKKYFKTFTLGHAYRSTYSVGSYSNNLLFVDIGDGFTSEKENGSEKNYYSKNIISTVTISEQFSPLIKLDATWNNSLISNIEIKKDRNISLSTTSGRLTEINGREIVIGSGYIIRDVILHKNFKIKGKPVKSDVNIKADVSIRNNKTVIRDISNGVSQPQAGQKVVSIKTSASYNINTTFSIRLFFDKTITKPIISSTFPSSNASSGVSIRFMLAQ